MPGVIHCSLSLRVSNDFESQHALIFYVAPSLADLDGDGKLEIIVGTSVGFLYVLNATGHVNAGWPRQMGDIQVRA